MPFDPGPIVAGIKEMSTYEPTEEDQRLEVLELQHALCNLASEAEEQTDYLERHGYAPSIDELVLELERHYIPGEKWVFHRLLTNDQLAALEPIAAKIKAMEQDPRCVWDTSYLRSEDWDEVRALSRQALKTFGFQWGLKIRQQLSATWPPGWQRDW